MKHQPLVSVILPVYNGEKFLKSAIDSILEQTYTNFELIIINDGSTDNSESIIRSYKDSRIKYVINDHNIKLIATLNKGIALAKGEYIARMDADDVSLPRRFEEQVNYLQSHQAIHGCGTWAQVVDNEGKATGRIKNIDTPDLLSCCTFFTCPLAHPSVMFRREVMLDNLYDPNAVNAEDFELWHRLCQKGYKLTNIPRYLFQYRWHESNISKTQYEKGLMSRTRVLKSDIEDLLDREITEAEIGLHYFSFQMYGFGQKKQATISLEQLKKEREWFELLSDSNKRQRRFPMVAFDALLLSRWCVLCISSKKYYMLPFISLPLLNIRVLSGCLRLLMNK